MPAGGGLRGWLISYDFFTKIQLKFLVSEVKLPCDYFSCLGIFVVFFLCDARCPKKGHIISLMVFEA